MTAGGFNREALAGMVGGYVVLQAPSVVERLRRAAARLPLLRRQPAEAETLPGRTPREGAMGLMDPLFRIAGVFPAPSRTVLTRMQAVRAVVQLTTRGRLGAAATAALATSIALLNWPGVSHVASPAQAVERPPTQAFAAPVWTELSRPIAQFALDHPELDRVPLRRSVTRNQFGGRSESLLWRSPDQARPLAQIVLRRAGKDETREPSLFVDIARTAARQSLAVTRWSPPAPERTKFGIVEVSDLQLSAADTSRGCLAFRFWEQKTTLEVTGWYCGGEGRPVARPFLNCFINRLDLVNAADDLVLRDVFVDAERSRDASCPSNRSASRRIAWMEADAQLPALRDRSASAMLERATGR